MWEKVSAERDQTQRDEAAAGVPEGLDKQKHETATPAVGKLKDLKRDEEYYFRLLRFQIDECLEGLVVDSRFKDLVEPIGDAVYRKIVQKPICLNDISAKNSNEEYTDVRAVQNDLDLIRDNTLRWTQSDSFNTKINPTCSKEEQRKQIRWMIDSFECTYMMKLDMIDKVVIKAARTRSGTSPRGSGRPRPRRSVQKSRPARSSRMHGTTRCRRRSRICLSPPPARSRGTSLRGTRISC